MIPSIPTSLQSFVRDHLALLKEDPVIRYQEVERIVAEHMQGRDDYPVLLFGLLVYSHLRHSCQSVGRARPAV